MQLDIDAVLWFYLEGLCPRSDLRRICRETRRTHQGSFFKIPIALELANYENNKQTYKLGDPTNPDTNLGPVVSLASAERIRKQVADAGAHSSDCPCYIN
jgi:hypothetical protein